MKSFVKILFVVFILTTIVYSCKKPEVYSKIPKIEFKSISIKDTITLLDANVRRVSIVFSVVDGDGDIGLKNSDTIYPYDTSSVYYKNLYIKLFEKQNGVYNEITDLTDPHEFRMPYVAEVMDGNVLKADIKTDLDYIFPMKYDSVYYEIFIYDRALNKSNTIKTSEIILKY